VTDRRGIGGDDWMPFFIFVHKNDNNQMYLYLSQGSNSDMQSTSGWHFRKVQ
jgi:hypothetical protein